MGSTDLDICLFQFLRFRFYSDLIRFVKPFLRASPPVWEKYLGDNTYIEPLRDEVLAFKKLWRLCMRSGLNWAREGVSSEDRALLEVCIYLSIPFLDVLRDCMYLCFDVQDMVRKYPFIPEPTIALACALNDGEISKVSANLHGY